MSGRGDNNKHGSSGRGASNQSGQGMKGEGSQEKMNHGKQTGGQPSRPDKPEHDTDSDRNSGKKKSKS
ncbi:MAG TPA: hypothetical protein VEY06_00715 [Flavisolibacter sp.]|jgi:hypothetical protein|nr:hypothetical protein [Flavisolibacter sp.]